MDVLGVSSAGRMYCSSYLRSLWYGEYRYLLRRRIPRDCRVECFTDLRCYALAPSGLDARSVRALAGRRACRCVQTSESSGH